jgi:hypothetical protein
MVNSRVACPVERVVPYKGVPTSPTTFTSLLQKKKNASKNDPTHESREGNLISKALRKSWDDPAKDTKEQSAPKSFTKKDNTVHVCILFLPLLKVWIIQSPAECHL